MEIFTVGAEATPLTAELLFGTVGVSRQLGEGLETEGAGLAEILEFSKICKLQMSNQEIFSKMNDKLFLTLQLSILCGFILFLGSSSLIYSF